MVNRAAGFSILIALFCLQATLQGDEPSAEAFGKSVVKANRRLRNAGFQYGKALGPILRGDGPGDAAELATAYANLVKTLEQVKSEIGKQEFPDSQESKDLFAAHQQYLKGQTFMISTGLADTLVIAVDREKEIDEKKTQIEELLESMNGREKADGVNLVGAMRAYAKAHELDLDALIRSATEEEDGETPR